MRLDGITEMEREREQRKKQPFKELSKDGFETCWTSCVCAHSPEIEHNLLGTSCSHYSYVPRVTWRGGSQPPPQHLAHRHLIKACLMISGAV